MLILRQCPNSFTCINAALTGRVYDDGNELSISRIDFGSKFLSEALRCSREHQNNAVFAIELQNVKERCKRVL